jgi:hypothetical protein
MENYLAGAAVILLTQFFRAVTIIILIVVSENLQESTLIKNTINSNKQKS